MATHTLPQPQSREIDFGETGAPAAYGDFMDPRVFVVPCEKPADYVGFSQACDGPTLIHVGIGLNDDQLRRIWEQRRRFLTVSLEQLRAIRDCKVAQIQVA